MNIRIPSLLSVALLCAAGALATPVVQAQVPASQAASSTALQATGAGSAGTDAVKARFAQRFPAMEVTAVRRTPYGLFEVQLGMDLVYTDEKVTWVMEGPLIDAMTRRDVTRERQEKLSAISFDQLPLDLAIKHVQGDGSRRIAIFEDPNCGYCKQLRKTLHGIDNLTIYTFLYPILSPDSRTKVRNVWCAADRAQAWDHWMLQGKTPPTAQCDTPLDQVLALGQQLMVRATPAIFFQDGTRASGAISLEQIKSRLIASESAQ